MIILLMLLVYYEVGAQQITEEAVNAKKEISSVPKKGTEATDPYRLNYADVYENMHYNQVLRPQVHYTPITGQIADPTGLIRYKGKYHLFYMYDEWSKRRRDNKNWGHAISDDCIYWEQLPPITNTIIDNRPGSGSGIIDWNNTLGLRTGADKTMAVFYTDYGRGVCLAFSTDAGKTWVRHKKNPVIPAKENRRDPNVFWFKPDQSWRMVIYDFPGFSFYKSDNLLDWQFLSKLDGFFECPDMIEMPLDGNKQNKKWVLIDGNGSYYVGEFDGIRFKPIGEKHSLGEETVLNTSGGRTNYYTKDIYATQTWKQSYEGDGPFYQLAFMMINEPPFHDRIWSQQMIFPVELSLKTINGRIVLCRNPIDGIKQLRYDPHAWQNLAIKPGIKLMEEIKGDVFEIIATIDLGKSKEIVFDIRGEKIIYNSSLQELSFMGAKEKITPANNQVKLRFIVDRNSIEIYANEGEVTFTRLFYPDASNMNLGLSASEGECQVLNLELYRLESIWLKREQELGYKR
ncbi:glycoside hydrolase family 32 protein [Terrimonas alba]|uniref:glycoside hydrolase family 32 protein n=1 Tax=Terrimonas alba TaxID=3349636 RepID=UPI0035F31FF0